jgi:replicative DNA helicase
LPLDKLFDKPPPQAPLAEMSLLGAMILEPNVGYDVINIIKSPEAFFEQKHAAIYAALVRTYDQKQAGNLVLLAEALADNDQLKDVGGTAYLEKLAAETPGPATAVHFAKIVADKYRLRKLIEVGGRIVYDAYNAGELGPDGAKPVIDAAEALVFEIAQAEESSDAQSLAQLVEEEFQRLEAQAGKGISGIRTHFKDLDELTTGLQPGDMIIVAARPSMGKSALALNLAEQIALGMAPPWTGKATGSVPVAIFSLEMSKSSIAQRMLSSASGISAHDMRSGRLNDAQYTELAEAMYALREAPIYVDDTPGLTVLGLRTKARRMVAQHGVKCIVVDYLQLMTAPGAAKESRQVEVSAISRGVKALARELKVPVICLSQLNRGPEDRTQNRPKMSDLRESGSLEQDADVIILLHREAYYHVGEPEWDPKNPLFNPENEEKLNSAELIIAKQRNGPTDVVRVVWDPSRARFRDLGNAWGGTGLPPGYARSNSANRDAFGSDAPFSTKLEVHTFSPGKKTGPIANHRDGGGPEREIEDAGDVGLPE